MEEIIFLLLILLKYFNSGGKISRLIYLVTLLFLLNYFELYLFYILLYLIFILFTLIFSTKFIFHSHTHHSHDSNLLVKDYNKLNKSIVFITNHEEDMTKEKIKSLDEEISENKIKNESKIFQGIELNYLGQHILLFNIKNYNFANFNIFYSGIYCWAHPVLALRKRNSFKKFFKIVIFINSIEIYNVKAAKRGSYFVIQNLILGLIGSFVFFTFPIIGHDIHEI